MLPLWKLSLVLRFLYGCLDEESNTPGFTNQESNDIDTIIEQYQDSNDNNTTIEKYEDSNDIHTTVEQYQDSNDIHTMWYEGHVYHFTTERYQDSNDIHVTIEKYPFIVSLESATAEHFCSGTIFSPRLIVTAELCVLDKDDIFVNAGVDDLNQTGTRRQMKKKHFIDSGPGGIALIELSKDLPFSTKISSPIVRSDYYPVSQATVIGWTSASSKLTATDVDCPLPLNIHDHTAVCLGKRDGQEYCKGDFGGPFYQETFVGVVITNTLVCGSRLPGSVARLTPLYLQWLRKKYREIHGDE